MFSLPKHPSFLKGVAHTWESEMDNWELVSYNDLHFIAFLHAKQYLSRILISHCSTFSLDPYAMVCVAELLKTAEILVLRVKSFLKAQEDLFSTEKNKHLKENQNAQKHGK